MEFLLVVIIAISLSMDAFSLSIAYGTIDIEKKQIYLLTIIVGMFHFIMPLIGLIIGTNLLSIININPSIIVSIVLSIIGIEMIYESFKQKETVKIMKNIEIILFGFAVSIDSFSIGLTLNNINESYISSAIIFAITSSFFTFLGLFLGNRIKRLIGKISTIIGGIALLIIGILYFL